MPPSDCLGNIHFLGARIHRHDAVASPAGFAEHHRIEVLRVAADAHSGDVLPGKKVSNGLQGGPGHRDEPPGAS